MKNKNGIIIGIIIVILVILIGGYFSYKLYCLNKYNIENFSNEEFQQLLDNFVVKDTMTINVTELEDNKYLTFNEIKIRNDFKNFKILDSSTEEYVRYALYNDGNITASFWMGGTMEEYVHMLSQDFELYSAQGIDNLNLTISEKKEFFENNNIKNDLDLINYLNSYKFESNNIFTNVKKMKENYFTKFITIFMTNLCRDITIIDGDYEGYIINLDNENKEAYILKNNKKYVFTFLKTNYFTDDYINELLSTLIILSP